MQTESWTWIRRRSQGIQVPEGMPTCSPCIVSAYTIYLTVWNKQKHISQNLWLQVAQDMSQPAWHLEVGWQQTHNQGSLANKIWGSISPPQKKRPPARSCPWAKPTYAMFTSNIILVCKAIRFDIHKYMDLFQKQDHVKVVQYTLLTSSPTHWYTK